jgi:glycosyltransferase involved in cell wall biosynthesis
MIAGQPARLAGPALFVVWAQRHRGTRSAWLAASMGIDDLRYFAPTAERGLRAALSKYPAQLVATVVALVQRRPRVLFVQSPPSFLAWVTTLYGAMTGSAVLIDAHSDAFERGIWTRPLWLSRAVARAATATLVTNQHWADRVAGWGGTAVRVPSIPATFTVGAPPPLADHANVAVVNTWAADEPLASVLDAALLLPDVTFHVTGRSDRIAELGRAVPDNVRFTGFLAEGTYHGLLSAVDAVVCLTTRDHTMQNGACEALSHGTPIVTSDWQVLRDYFSAGTAHVDNSPAGIAAGVRAVLADVDGHRASMEALRDRRIAEWEATRVTLIALVNDRIGGRQHRSRRRPDREEHE